MVKVIQPGSRDRFLQARRYASAWSLLSSCVCLSVCLDVRHTPVSCLNGLIYLKIFRPSGSRIILVLRRYQISRVNLSAGSIDKRWLEKICNFRLKSAFISEMAGGLGCVTVTSHYGTLIGSHRCRIDKCQFR